MEKSSNRGLSLDNVVMVLSITYVILPIIIFAFGWLNNILAIVVCALLICLWHNLYKSFSVNSLDIKVIDKSSIVYWIISISLLIIWICLSGIGGYTYQNYDFWARNAIYSDLINKGWPIIYNLDNMEGVARDYLGSGKVAFSYYFTWWLPAALTCKVLGLVESLQGLVLLIYSLLGIFLIFYNINRYFNKTSYYITLTFILFSGLDIIGSVITHKDIEIGSHLENWATLFQYSSNTTQLYWVFNQSIPIWLIIILVLQLKDNRHIAALASLSFAYSPWATIGIIPIAIALSFGKDKNNIKVFNIINIIIPILTAIIFGTFYTGGETKKQMLLTFNEAENTRYAIHDVLTRKPEYIPFEGSWVIVYILFIVLEFGDYWILTYKNKVNKPLKIVILLELVLIPFVVLGGQNFIMRASIPSLFILMICILNSLLDENTNNRIKIILLVLLIIGSITPINEVERSIETTIRYPDYRQFSIVKTLGNISNLEDIEIIDAIKNQFYIYNYENKPFFKYLAKK